MTQRDQRSSDKQCLCVIPPRGEARRGEARRERERDGGREGERDREGEGEGEGEGQFR